MVRTAFFKGHGHGNDYLVFEEGPGVELSPPAIRRICDRWRGPGADGIVVIGASDEDGRWPLRMFNPDGSEFERSGNGLRVAALWLHRGGLVKDERFEVEVGGDVVWMQVERSAVGRAEIAVGMGQVSFPEGPPFVSPGAARADGLIVAHGVEVQPVSVGNPHAVVFLEQWTGDEFEVLGARLCVDPAFPMGTNVQLARVLEPGRLEISIWERGVGPTASSGTSACAASAAAVRAGHLDAGRIEVQMDGGIFLVDVSPEWLVELRGPVVASYDGRLAEGVLDGMA